METPITLDVGIGVSFYLAILIVCAVNGLKWLAEKAPWLWTNNIPTWAWILAAWVFAAIPCWLLKVDVLSRLIGDATLRIAPPWSFLLSALAISLSSNVLYAIAKPLAKKIKTPEGKVICLPPGEPLPAPVEVSVTEKPPEPAPLAAEPPIEIEELQPFDAKLLYLQDMTPAAVLLTSPSGKWRIVRLT